MHDSIPSFEELLTIYENVQDGICVIDAHAVILRANPAFAFMTGYSVEELSGKAIHQIIELDPVHDLRSFSEASPEGHRALLERTGHRKNGSSYVAEIQGTFSSYGGQPVLITIVRDVTDRKLRAEQYRRSRERLSLVVQQSPMAIITWDTEFRVNQWNLAAEEIFGHTREEAMGRHARFIVPEVARPHVDQVWENLMTMKGGRRSTNENLRKDGETILCEWYNAPLVDGDGQVVGVLSLVEDVTERRRLEAERERLMSAIEQSDDAVLITDAEGRIQYVNPAFERSTGYRSEEVLGQNSNILRSEEHDDSFFEEMWETISAGRSWRADIVNRRKDGSLVTESVSISPIVDDQGRIVNYVSVQRDVTKLRSMEEQLNQAQKMEAIGRLAGGVAHDFNNMLNVILGYTELILPQLDENNPHAREMMEIDRAARRSADLTRQLLAFSRKQIVEPRIVDLNSSVTEMRSTLSRMIGEDVELIFRPSEDLWPVRVDPSQVDQILANLTANARDAMPSGGRLVIETANVHFEDRDASTLLGARGGDFVRLSISDTGAGMSAETRAHIFEPFFTTKEGDKGTGLGLATVQGIVTQNEGFVLVTSEEHLGTTFEIHLPRCGESPDEPAVREEDRPALAQQTILLVEDDEMVRDLTSAMLRRLGHRVLAVGSGAAAQELFARQEDEIDLLITDVVMPGMSGRELQVVLQERRPDLKTLFISGYTADIISDQGVLEEGVQFIQKPFDIDGLSRKLRETVDSPDASPRSRRTTRS